jgi:hypothetical protein
MKRTIQHLIYMLLMAQSGIIITVRAQDCTVNILIAYTDEAADSLNGNQSAVAKIIESAQGLNTSFIYSNVAHQAILVRTIQLDNFETGCFANNLNQFQANTYINTLRDKYHADIAALVMTNDEFCGLPFISDTVATSNIAYCGVNYQCMITNFALSHQIAHLYGCSHYVETRGETNPSVYSYGHGYSWAFNDCASFSTILGVNDDDFCGEDEDNPCNLIPYFSNPSISYQGVPLGMSGVHDNARVLNQNANVIGSFKLLPANQQSLSDTINLFNIALGTAKDTLATGQSYVIKDSASVRFQTGKKIVLNPGFNAAEGVRFEAIIEEPVTPCGQ